MYKGEGRRAQRMKSKPAPFVGTRLQISLARKIYAQFLNCRIQIIENCDILSLLTDKMDGKMLAEWYLEHLSRKQRRASWWIEHRDELTKAWFIGEYIQKYLLVPPSCETLETEKALVWNESLLCPENPLHLGAVELVMEADADFPEHGVCLLRYERNASLSLLARQMDMVWRPEKNAYCRRIEGVSAPLLDRCAEIGSRLLQAGFCVLPLDARVHSAICSGKFSWEYRRWILPGSEPTRLRLVFPHDKELYRRVCSLGAFWNGRQIEVGIWHTDALYDLARLYGFQISPEASIQMERWEELRLHGKTVYPESPPEFNSTDDDPVQRILTNDASIPEDLIDDN